MSGARVVAACCALQLAIGAVCLRGADWPQWRGPGSAGVSAERGLPLDWTATQNVAWKTALPGRGHSSPIVWGKRIFLTTAIEGEVLPGAAAPTHYLDVTKERKARLPEGFGADRRQTLKVLALDADTGRVLWERTAYDGPVYDSRHKKGSFASPTPITDGRTVYAFFGSEGVFAYDVDGALRWKADLGRLPTMGLSTGTSPVLFRNLLILQCDEDLGARSFLIALDKTTGAEVWKTPRRLHDGHVHEAGRGVSWATPVIVTAAGHPELITSGSESVIAYDPATGRELWRTAVAESNAIPSPVFSPDLVYVSAGFPRKRTIAIRPGGTGELTAASGVAWTYDRGTAYVASPLLYRDYLYLLSDAGILTCLDAKTGAVQYDSGRVPVPASFTASPVAFGDVILLTSEDGDTFVIEAGPRHRVLRVNPLGEPVIASLAIANGRIYIRGEQHLYAISTPR